MSANINTPAKPKVDKKANLLKKFPGFGAWFSDWKSEIAKILTERYPALIAPMIDFEVGLKYVKLSLNGEYVGFVVLDDVAVVVKTRATKTVSASSELVYLEAGDVLSVSSERNADYKKVLGNIYDGSFSI
jgi:hypothetical protein